MCGSGSSNGWGKLGCISTLRYDWKCASCVPLDLVDRGLILALHNPDILSEVRKWMCVLACLGLQLYVFGIRVYTVNSAISIHSSWYCIVLMSQLGLVKSVIVIDLLAPVPCACIWKSVISSMQRTKKICRCMESEMIKAHTHLIQIFNLLDDTAVLMT